MKPYLALAIPLLFTLLPATPTHAGGAGSIWPGPAPCNTTLQACIDAAANSTTVSVDTDTPINESINLYNRSLSLVAAAGRHPSLTSGNWISISSAPILGDQSVSVRGLRLTNSYVRASYNGTGTANYDLSGLVLEQTGGAPAYIRVEANAGTVQARVYDNRVTGLPRSLNNGLIELVNGGATLDASAYFNQVSSTAGSAVEGAGFFVDVINNGTGTLKLHGNSVRGGFYRSAIFVSEGLFSSTASAVTARVYSNVIVCANNASGGGTAGSGIGFVVGNGSINGQAINNTVTRCGYSINANQWSGGGAGAAISGIVKNNLVIGDRGLVFTPALTTGLSNDYNLLNVNSNQATPGVHTITAPANVVDLTAPRLRSDSPAIDAADTTTLGLGIIINALPTTDADGLRRLKGPGTVKADIGAYEYGDLNLQHVATAANTTTYITRIDNSVLDSQGDLSPIATPNWNRGGSSGVANNTAFGSYYFGSKWRLFNEDTVTSMPVGAAFNTFVPAPGGGSFRHVTSAANNSGFTSRLDDGSVNNLPDRIILVTQNWSAGSGIYNAHPIGLFYLALGGPGSWFVANIDQVAGGLMPDNAGFNIYAQEASPSAFRVTSSSGGNSLVLDHPLLNGQRCAQVHASRLFDGSAVAQHFDVYYGEGDARWRIFSYTPLAVGTQFNVVLDPAQISACSDRLFADGFQ